MAAVGAGLLGLQLGVLEEEGFELAVLFLDFGLGLGIGGLFSLHVDFTIDFLMDYKDRFYIGLKRRERLMDIHK